MSHSENIDDIRQEELELRERERQLDSLMGHLPGLAYRALADEHWTCLFVSKGIEDVTGYTPEDFTSRRVDYIDIMLPEDRQATREAILTALRERGTYEDEHRIRHKDGSIRWIWARGHGVFAPDGSLRFLEGLNLDITARKQAEEALRESEERFRGTFENAAVGIVHNDPAGRFLRVNGKYCEIVGYSREELLQKALRDIIPPDDLAAFDELYASCFARGEAPPFGTARRYLHKDGSTVCVEVFSSFQRDASGRPVYAIAMVQDITERQRLEGALRESEQRWRSLTETLPQLVWSATPDGTCDYFSSQWTEHTGVAEAELLGWRWLETLHPDDREPTRRFWLNSVSGHHAYDIEYRVRRRDGEYRWFKTRGAPIRDTDGNIVKWFGTCTDITELRDSEGRFRGIFENAAVGIAQTHPSGRFLRLNEKFCSIVGYTREELLQKTFQDITHPDDVAIGVSALAALLRGESLSCEYEKRYVRKEGSTVWAELFISMQRDAAGEPAYAVAVIQDISERKRLDAELRQAKDAAEAANRAKDEFLANVSHEIRTPMNAIIGMTELVLDTPLDEDQRQGLKTVKSAADSLLGIINDLLDFSKIEAGKLELIQADFSLRGAVGDTSRALAVRAHKKGLELIYQVPPDVPDALIGDVGRLRQVLLNLAGNAVKFTDEGEVVVHVEMSDVPPTPAAGDVGLRFTVRDTGIGIPAEQQERIFGAFEQEDTSTTRKYGGTGLGLTIAARLVDLMGGSITVDSAPGRGSTFTFTASFGQQPHATESASLQPPDSPGARLKNLPVLVVDDNGTNRQIVEEWLRNWQMNPTAVGDGMAAMDALWHRAANDGPYALVLLDARMPDADGLTVAAMIRERTELAATRIILLTSGERLGDPARIRELRIDAQLLKPVQQDELLESIYRVMSRSRGNASPPARTRSRQLAGAAPVPAATPLQILVAEDNELSAQVLEQSLIRQGHRVRLASNGREVLTLAEQGGFDLVLLDVHMPELDGFQVVRAIRERESTTGGHLPIIALTARSRKEDRERSLAAGMDDFQTKPIRPADLLAAIDRVLKSHSSRQSRKQDLADAPVLLAACGGDTTLLRKMCQTLMARVPEHLAALRDALRDQDAPRLREAAHKCCGMLSEFSGVAGDLAGHLEDLAAGTQLDRAALILEQLETTAQELVNQIDGITVEELRHQADAVHERSGTTDR